MIAIRKFCIVVAVGVGLFATMTVQAQEPANAPPPDLDHALLTTDVSQPESPQDQVGQNQVLQNQAGQNQVSQDQDPPRTAIPQDGKSLPDAPTPTVEHPDSKNPNDQSGKQTKRILWIVPNFRSVSADTKLPPMSFKSQLWLATQDTFDYSSVIFVGALAGFSMAQDSEPSFGQGAEGFGKYYWHTYLDAGLENYLTEAIVPAATREDPRYYTLGHGGLFKRTGYAVTRLLITRTNSGKSTVNLSEVVGAGAAAGLGNLYYQGQSNPWVKTYQRWGTQLGLDGMQNVLKEFWPDINQKIFRGKY